MEYHGAVVPLLRDKNQENQCCPSMGIPKYWVAMKITL